jgi:serine/threonine protein kinase/Tfp pilus assembly protein PilF
MVGKTISHYKILEKLGEGGMGIVYKAQDLKLDRFVALKFLPSHLTTSEEEKQRFIHEAKAASALDHNNICAIHEIDEIEDGQLFISMAYYEGETLDKRIKEKPLPIEEAIDIAIQIAQGLAKAHEKEIVHRDVKPANIMLTKEGVVKVLDFGLAKLSKQTKLTKEGTTLGTITYMSPEQARGEAVDQRTDIWSLGVMIYEMFTGQLPFRGEYDQAVVYLILNEEPEPISGMDKEGERIINKALAKILQERYQQVEDILKDLKSLKKKTKSELLQKQSMKESVPSIAVLPLVNMSADPEQEYFCDGMAEEIINALTHIKDLHVVARTSAFSFRGKEIDIREIGRKLNVETLLEGSVRRAGNRLRITAQLINVTDGYHLWSERFDREMKDVFAIQDEISLAIVEKLKVQLLGEEKAQIVKRHTEDPEAYNLYLKGLYFLCKWSEEGTQKGLEYFQQAIEADPNFALAYLGIADIYTTIGLLSLSPPQEIFQKAKDMLKKSLEIDNTLYDAHGTSAGIAFWRDWNWKEAENEFKKALGHNPGHARTHGGYAWYLAVMERFDEAFKEIKMAQELDPLLPLYYAWATAIYTYAGRFEESIEQFRRAIDLDPNMGLAYFHVGINYLIQKKYREAIVSFQKAIEYTTGLGWAESSMFHHFVSLLFITFWMIKIIQLNGWKRLTRNGIF